MFQKISEICNSVNKFTNLKITKIVILRKSEAPYIIMIARKIKIKQGNHSSEIVFNMLLEIFIPYFITLDNNKSINPSNFRIYCNMKLKSWRQKVNSWFSNLAINQLKKGKS